MTPFFDDFDAFDDGSYDRKALRQELGPETGYFARCVECRMVNGHVDDCPERPDEEEDA